MSNNPEPPDQPAAEQYIGQRVAGVFTIEALVGTGASAHVYRASQVGIERPVAIKVMHSSFLASEEMRARFHREARVTSRIGHPAVVPVLMTGELPKKPPTQGEAFIVYEFVSGRTLREVIRAGSLQVPTIIGILVAAAEGVGAAHQAGVVHRDLKPENLMLVCDAQGATQVRILDFGLARVCESIEAPLTHTGAVLGTPEYLSPEGALGQPATPRSDVYSLAIIAYECLTGAPPFRDTSPIRVLMQQIERQPPPLQPLACVGEVPSLVAEVIYKNLDKAPEQRANNALDLAVALREAANRSHLAVESCGPSTDLWQTAESLDPKPAPVEPHAHPSVAPREE
jgi:serine/threonine-protein kinase